MKITLNRLISTAKFGFVVPLAIISRRHVNNIWLVSERYDQARDNGFVFFKYLRTVHPELKVYYIISKNAKDRQKIEKYGNIISFDSWKHYYYFLLSSIHISAHVHGCCPHGAVVSRWLKKPFGIHEIFIPHGVSYGISDYCLAQNAKIDLFICSGYPEYENVKKNYGYKANQVAYTGFPRLDEWHNLSVNPKQVVIMPTWRRYLALGNDINFEETEFFRAYHELIESEELHAIIESQDIKLVFYLHNDMRKFLPFFHSKSPNIIIVDNDEQYDIQTVLKESSLLITDYSSVHFDFAYMAKPVVYYQFDREEFFSNQYKKSTFDAEVDGFGPVAKDIQTLLAYLCAMIRTNYTVEDKYIRRMRAFYQLYDDKNCERVYQTIEKHEWD